MSKAERRINGNRIRGPQSALTDFLASNRISAAEIQANYERRRQEELDRERSSLGNRASHPDQAGQDLAPHTNSETGSSQRRSQSTAKSKKKLKGNQDDAYLAGTMGASGSARKTQISSPAPGQLHNCEICSKRFTVTPYSATGPGGGLLCTKCSSEQAGKRKQDVAAKKSTSRGRRREIQSDLLNGDLRNGSLSLLDLCIKEVANNVHDIEEFGDLPPSLLDSLSQILSKRRMITSRTLDLFLGSQLTTLRIFDCGNLDTEDYFRMFSICHHLKTLDLRNACQFKDEVVDYVAERHFKPAELRLEAANLISNSKMMQLLGSCGRNLKSLKLAWLDDSMDDAVCLKLAETCPNLSRVKLSKCFKLTNFGTSTLARLSSLEHLSLDLPDVVSSDTLKRLIISLGSSLKTFSIRNASLADGSDLATLGEKCRQLDKLRLTHNSICSDVNFAELFKKWSNPPLRFADLSSNRSVDYTEPDGSMEAVGLGSDGFTALLRHSETRLEVLDVSSCRHVTLSAMLEAFRPPRFYPLLREINVSFLPKVDAAVIQSMLRVCPKLQKITAFGCFSATGAVVPADIALIGVFDSSL